MKTIDLAKELDFLDSDIEIDPTGHYPDINPSRLLGACGVIPMWVAADRSPDNTIFDILEREYQFPLFEMHGSTITNEGVHQYPEDPDLYPLIQLTRGEEVMYVYQYAITAIVSPDGSTFVVRID